MLSAKQLGSHTGHNHTYPRDGPHSWDKRQKLKGQGQKNITLGGQRAASRGWGVLHSPLWVPQREAHAAATHDLSHDLSRHLSAGHMSQGLSPELVFTPAVMLLEQSVSAPVPATARTKGWTRLTGPQLDCEQGPSPILLHWRDTPLPFWQEHVRESCRRRERRSRAGVGRPQPHWTKPCQKDHLWSPLGQAVPEGPAS